MAGDGIWRGSLLLSLLLHGAAVTATALLTVGGAEAGAMADAPAATQPAGLRGDTFEIDGLVRDAAPAARPAAPAWAFDQAARLSRWLDAVRSGRADSSPPPTAGPSSKAEPELAARPSGSRPDQAPDGASSPQQDQGSAKSEPAAPEPDPARGDEREAPAARAVSPEPSRAEPRQPSGALGRASGRFGAGTNRDGVLLLAPAFTRAVPAAVSADPVWSELPAGAAGSIAVTIALDERGAVREVQAADDGREPLRRLVERTMAMLSSGRFALGEAVGAGSLDLRIEVHLSDEPAAPGVAGSGERPGLELGYEPPRAAAPGRGWFTTASGRHFEARVFVLRSGGESRRSGSTTPAAAEAGGGSADSPRRGRAAAGRRQPRSSAGGEPPAQVQALPSAPETG